MQCVDRASLMRTVSSGARVLTLKDVCALLATSQNTALRLLRTGQLRGYRIPDTPRGRWKISEQALIDYQAAREAREEERP